MKLFFYILSKGRRSVRFETATDLDQYVHSNKLSAKATIEMRDDSGKVVGRITLKKYFELEKSKR